MKPERISDELRKGSTLRSALRARPGKSILSGQSKTDECLKTEIYATITEVEKGALKKERLPPRRKAFPMSITSQSSPTQAAAVVQKVPSLENGDRLTRPEFERRYEAMPHLKKAELVEGVVYLPSPVRYEGHGRQHSFLNGWLGVYSASTPGVAASVNTTIRLDLDNEPQPDVLLRLTTGGQSHVAADGFLEGPPELVAEVASSSVTYDLHQKLDVYRRHGVREYIVWQTSDNAIDWFVLRDGRYDRLPPSEAEIYKSEIFPGLWLDAMAMLRGDLATVLKVLGEGIASREHAEFVQHLTQAL
jgi:Uma2 family endonuclease